MPNDNILVDFMSLLMGNNLGLIARRQIKLKLQAVAYNTKRMGQNYGAIIVPYHSCT